MIITGRAKLAGVIGWPVGHSLSPALHGYWLEEHGVDGAYVPLAVNPERFSPAIEALQHMGFTGVNVTIPHKESAFALADELAGDALAIGAVNLLLFKEGRIVGRNTDAEGLFRSLAASLGVECVMGAKVAILGAGGAARAALLACDRLGAAAISLVTRRKHRGDVLKESLRSFIRPALDIFCWDEWPTASRGARLLINATSAGMKGRERLDLSLDDLPAGAAVCDLVYNPLVTDLLRGAKARGHVVIDGLGMLMYQAEPAFEALFGSATGVTPAARARLECLLHDQG